MGASDPRSHDANEAFWAKAMEAVKTGMKLKAIMLKKDIRRCQCPCPRCGGMINAVLAGRKNHVHMACEGQCGMNLME